MQDSKALDRIDYAILGALQNDARISNKELAAKIHLSPSSCLERVRRLRASGAIRGFHAELDMGALGMGLQAMVAVRLHNHSRGLIDDLRGHLLAQPNIVALFHVAGADDFLVHVAVSDSDALRELILEVFTTREEVARVQTSIVFESQQLRPLPVPS